MSSFAAFLGCGIVTPFQRDQKNDFANASGLDLIRSCVDQVLGTNAGDDQSKGDLEWRGDFGSKLYRILHRKGGVLDELARVYVVDALAKWEPRVQVSAAKMFFSPSENLYVIRVRYDVIDRNVPGNNVLFDNVEQDVLLPVSPS